MRKLLVASIVAVLTLVAAPAAFAEETKCTGTFGAVTLDNVRVPDGATCTLNGTTVKGTIYVETDSTLRATGVSVIGNVQAEDSRLVIVRGGSSVGGSIQVVQGSRARVVASEIGGDILYDEQTGALIIRRNEVGGNVQVFQNTGGVSISGNVIDGNLQCKENSPPPTGGGNIVHGNKEDQCKNL
jgi:hypothetical protein